jgi:hypothetical protein
MLVTAQALGSPCLRVWDLATRRTLAIQWVGLLRAPVFALAFFFSEISFSLNLFIDLSLTSFSLSRRGSTSCFALTGIRATKARFHSVEFSKFGRWLCAAGKVSVSFTDTHTLSLSLSLSLAHAWRVTSS